MQAANVDCDLMTDIPLRWFGWEIPPRTGARQQGLCRELPLQQCVGDPRIRRLPRSRSAASPSRSACSSSGRAFCRDARVLELSRLERLGVGPAVDAEAAKAGAASGWK